MRRAAGATTLLLLYLSSPSASADVLPDDVLRLERDGKFAESRVLLQELKTPDAQTHLALLDEIERVDVIHRDYTQSGMHAEARRALEAVLAKLDATRDAYLILRVQRTIDGLRRPGDAEAMAQALLDRADGLLARGAHARAKEVYATVAASAAADVGQATVSRAKRGVLKAERARVDDEPATFMQELAGPMPGAGRTLLQWVLWGAVIGLLFFLGGRLRRTLLLRDGTVIELVDLTSSGDARGPANHELNEALKRAIDRIITVGAGRGSATLEANALPESGARPEDGGLMPPERLNFVDPELEDPQLASYSAILQVAPVVQLGPVGINPQQLWQGLRWIFTRSHRHSVAGTLFQSDGQFVLQVSQIDRRTNKALHRWHALSPVISGRASCILDIATQIVLAEVEGTPITTNCESLRTYVAGAEALASADDAPDALASARRLLQRSVALDPNNWLGRFHLGIVLRKLGDTGSAVRNLRMLDDGIRRTLHDPDAAATSLRAYCDSRPDFPYIVRYHLASALAQSGDAASLRNAAVLFEEVTNAGSGPHAEALARNDRHLYLEMLGRSGTTALELGKLQERPSEQVGRQLQRCVEWFNQHAEELERISPADHAAARGLVLHGFGRYHYLHGNNPLAVKILKESTLLVPKFVDAHVNLAQAYLKGKDRVAPDWPLQVKTSLDRALTLDSTHAKARYVYAKFHFSEAARDLPKAEQYLRDGLPHVGTLFLYAQVLEGQGKYAEAAQALDRSFAMAKPTKQIGKRVDYRITLYGSCVLEMARAERRSPRLDWHIKKFDEVRKSVTDPKDSLLLQQRRDQIEAALKRRVTQSIAQQRAPAATGTAEPRKEPSADTTTAVG